MTRNEELITKVNEIQEECKLLQRLLKDSYDSLHDIRDFPEDTEFVRETAERLLFHMNFGYEQEENNEHR